jgi:hypothetical protein
MSILGTMLRDRRLEMTVEQLVESHWELGENPMRGFQTFIEHVIMNSQNCDIMRADESALSEEWW